MDKSNRQKGAFPGPVPETASFRDCAMDAARLARADIAERIVCFGGTRLDVDGSGTPGGIIKMALYRVAELSMKGWSSSEVLEAVSASGYFGESTLASTEFEDLVHSTHMHVQDLRAYGMGRSEILEVINSSVETAVSNSAAISFNLLRRMGVK